MNSQPHEQISSVLRQEGKLTLLRKLIKAFSTLCSVVISFVITIILFNAYLKFRMKRPIEGPPPEAFPIVVFWHAPSEQAFHAKVIELEGLNEFKKNHPNTTFLLPPGGKATMERELALQAKGIETDIAKHYPTGRAMYVWAFLEKSTSTYQNWGVRFQHGNDHVNVGYYKATADSVTPTYIERYFGPGTLFTGCPFILLVLGLLVWGSVKLINLIPFFNPTKLDTHAT